MSKPKIALGKRWDPDTGRVSGEFSYELESHITLIAPTSAGKGTMLEIPNLLTGLRDISVLSIDPSGQNAAVCAKARRDMNHDTVVLNPFNLHKELYADLEDVGCNPLLTLNPGSPKFCEDAMSLADAIISIENDPQPHFPNAARGLITWLIMYMRIQHGTGGTLGHVRDALTGDLEQTAGEAVALKHPNIANLAYKYKKLTDSRELQCVISTAETQTRWLESVEMRHSLSGNGVGDFARLKDKLTSLFLILPAGIELENHGPWLRLMVTCALNSLYRRGTKKGFDVLMVLSEFAALGKLAPIRAAFGQARKYGIRLWPVLQDIGQLFDLYGHNGATSFIANSGCVVGLTPNDPETAGWMSNFASKHHVMSASYSQDEQGRSSASYSAQEEPLWSPDDIRELQDEHGLVWTRGHASPQPVVLESWYKNPKLKHIGRKDPFHSD